MLCSLFSYQEHCLPLQAFAVLQMATFSNFVCNESAMRLIMSGLMSGPNDENPVSQACIPGQEQSNKVCEDLVPRE